MDPHFIDLTHSPGDQPANTNLFVIDTQPSSEIPHYDAPSVSTPDDIEGKLLLPPHVSVMGSVPVEIIAPATEDQDYVEYLDYGGGPRESAFARYFQVETDKVKTPSVVVCKKCGAKGEHKTSACPVIICLTCGVRNEHSTNSCPISKVCFACGMKGHLNAASRYHFHSQWLLTCSQNRHVQTVECLTHWRIYTYASDVDRIRTLEIRKTKKAFPLGHGGEGYIAEDSWCYNCGENGHWGDDCDALPHIHDIPEEFSAFGNNNLWIGPFSEIQSGVTEREPREWEIDSEKWNDWNGRLPTNVGRQGKRKEIARMRAREAEDDDDDDRFTSLANPVGRNGKQNVGNKKKPPSQPKKMRMEFNIRGAAKTEPKSRSKSNPGNLLPDAVQSLNILSGSKEGRALISRISSDGGNREDTRHRGERSDKDRSRRRDYQTREDKNSSRETERRREADRGPRYKGGYSSHR
ncbi:hypothetical protein D9757_000030 [Collybiopsis confluens]|uniref:CCHC-type domain-containing protein n=1 Tax=Collybiopsis confluens TaxID=2823264 RepID=A0A8H5MH84_9AGAR|nr:hypothetical protein D9757_000030 [Collybiopsis confluens]